MPNSWFRCLIFSLVWIFLSVTIKSGKVDRCPVGKYGVLLSSGVLICKDCTTFSKCPDGMGMAILWKCGDIINEHANNVHCVHCFPGKNFSVDFDSTMCRPCQSMTCHPNEAFSGECNPSEDTTQCTGICKKGYFPRSGRLDDCEPCSLCKSPKARRNQKCVHDKMPREKQCEVYTGSPSTTIATEQDGVVTKGKEKNDEQIVKNDSKYNFLGHPALFSSFLVIIAFLCTCLLFQCQKRYRKRTRTSTSNVPAVHFVPTGETDTGGSVQMVDENTDLDENENDSVPVDLVRVPSTSVQSNRRSSASMLIGKRKVSFSRQTSNPASGKDEERRVLLETSDASDSDCNPDVFDEQAATISSTSMRKKSLPSSSTGKRGPRLSLSRQNSNPGSEQRNEESGIRKSKTFSSFSSIISGQKATPEETKPILSSDNNGSDIPPVSINMNTPIQEHCQDILTKKPLELNASVYTNVCMKLNQEIEGKDWKALAGLMGYSNEFVKNLIMKYKNEPAEALISNWETKSGHDVKALIGLLEKIGRGDIIELLRQENP